MLRGKKADMARRFARGKIAVMKVHGPVECEFGARFFLMIGGQFVCPISMPNQGYRTYKEAQRDGTAFKRECVRALRPSMFDIVR